MTSIRRIYLGSLLLVTLTVSGLAMYGHSSASSGRIAMLSGASGSISTLECYDLPTPFRAHPYYSTIDDPFDRGLGCNQTDNHPADGVTGTHAGGLSAPVDTVAGSSSPVWVQVDYLPNLLSGGISGGYVYAYQVYSACAQYTGTSYSGKKIQVDVLYYDRFSSYINGNSAIYQHVDPNVNVASSSSTAYTIAWNNANATQKMWSPSIEVFKMNNTTTGGLSIGGVSQRGSQAPLSCSGGSHLHQEVGGSVYNFYDYWGKSVTARYSDSHYLSLSGIVGTAP